MNIATIHHGGADDSSFSMFPMANTVTDRDLFDHNKARNTQANKTKQIKPEQNSIKANRTRHGKRHRIHYCLAGKQQNEHSQSVRQALTSKYGSKMIPAEKLTLGCHRLDWA